MSEETEQGKPKAIVTIESVKGIFTFQVRKGLGFQALCAKESTPIDFDCREGDCGVCIFQTISGAENLSSPTFQEKDFLKAMGAEPDERLACQCRIMGDVKIRVEFP